MFKLIYVSSALKRLSSDELMEILDEARRHNGTVGITGVLLYCDGSFMQLLEGPESDVRSLYARIVADRRHTDMRIISTHCASERWMNEWSMAFTLCAHREELEDVVNLAKGLEGLKDRISDNVPLRSVLVGFVERNLRLLGA
jgi:hypothetical protein